MKLDGKYWAVLEHFDQRLRRVEDWMNRVSRAAHYYEQKEAADQSIREASSRLHSKVPGRVLDLAERILAVEDLPKDVAEAFREGTQRLRLPLSDVLSKVPGDTVADRAKHLGIARQTYYQWLRGAARPNSAQAANLSKLTGFPEHLIRGRVEADETVKSGDALKSGLRGAARSAGSRPGTARRGAGPKPKR